MATERWGLVGEDLEEGGTDVGDGDGGDVVEGDDDTTVLLDTVDGACDTLERSTEDADFLANLVGEVLVTQEHHTVILHRGHTHEVLHLTVRNPQDGGELRTLRTPHDITEREQNLTGALHPRDTVVDAPDKDKVVNGGHQHTLGLTLMVLSLPGQWKEILHMMAVEEIPNLHGAPAVAMGNTHGEPLFEFIGNTFIKNTIGGHRANNILRRGNRRF